MMMYQTLKFAAAACALAVLAACSTTAPRGSSAPVEDRGSSSRSAGQAPAPVVNAGAGAAASPTGSSPVAATGTVVPAPVKNPPGFENAGKPGYYTVKPGDTMIRIGLENGQSWRDIVRWNGIENPNIIEVGQVLRVIPPGTSAPGEAVTRPVATPVVAPVAASSAPSGATRTTPTTAAASSPQPAVAAPLPPASSPSDENVDWMWPTTNTQMIAGFDEVKNKGLDIGGKLGDAVVAAGDGRVVYSGSGLRGYGNLIIIKHNNTFLTAYAHNQTLLVKEDQSVRKGQKIAEMGQSDAERVKLHFEIRRQGKPVDPMRYLPAR
jgi:lipoprotein NlpD